MERWLENAEGEATASPDSQVPIAGGGVRASAAHCGLRVVALRAPIPGLGPNGEYWAVHFYATAEASGRWKRLSTRLGLVTAVWKPFAFTWPPDDVQSVSVVLANNRLVVRAVFAEPLGFDSYWGFDRRPI